MMSSSSSNWLGRLFKKTPKLNKDDSPGLKMKPDLRTKGVYKKGDFIGQKYEVYGVLGKGGFGIVYLVLSHETKEVLALKTFLDEFVTDQEVLTRFYKEASVWVELGDHPNLVRANFIDMISDRLFIGMEYIAPNDEGLNTLEEYLHRQPPDLAQSLRWTIQICHGMEYAYSKGVRAHRDLKPANIMITEEKTAKVTDFGLAGVIRGSSFLRSINSNTQSDKNVFSGQTMLGAAFGTPTHMPPEQFENAAGCDERSDIYSFGIVLYQLASGGRLPFLAPLPRDDSDHETAVFWHAMRRLHRESPAPKLESSLFDIINRCLKKQPQERYKTFKELRADSELLLLKLTGEKIPTPRPENYNAWVWSNKGNSLNNLGRYKEAITCLDKALALDPQDEFALNNKGNSLNSLGRQEEAIQCYDRAIKIDSRYANPWFNKGIVYYDLGNLEESIRCFDHALEIDPRYGFAWYSKGNTYNHLDRFEEAIPCFEKAIELDNNYIDAWNNKGVSLFNLERYEEVILCCDRVLELDSQYVHAWNNKGNSLGRLGRHEEALIYLNKALELDPRYYLAWNNKGFNLYSLGRYEEAISCCEKALKISKLYVDAWNTKALAEDKLGKWWKSVESFTWFLKLAPAKYSKEIDYAQKRVDEMCGR